MVFICLGVGSSLRRANLDVRRLIFSIFAVPVKGMVQSRREIEAENSDFHDQGGQPPRSQPFGYVLRSKTGSIKASIEREVNPRPDPFHQNTCASRQQFPLQRQFSQLRAETTAKGKQGAAASGPGIQGATGSVLRELDIKMAREYPR